MGYGGIKTVGDLKKSLLQFPDDFQIRILDGFNGGGSARVINLGPVHRYTYPNDGSKEYEDIIENNEDNYEFDKEDLGKPVIVMGYGCY
jgi:hypothetical protein